MGIVVPELFEMASLTRWSCSDGVGNEPGPGSFHRVSTREHADMTGSSSAVRGTPATSLEDAIAKNDAKAAAAAHKEAESALARGASRGTLHWKTAARKTSRLAKRVKALKKA